MFLCNHILTPRPDQSPCRICLFLNVVMFLVLDLLFDPELFKIGSGFRMETSDEESAGSFCELSMF